MSFLGSFFGGSILNSDKFEILDKKAFKEVIQQRNIQLVDVRTPREFNSGHINKAINIDLFQASNFKFAFEKLDRKRPLYLYCRSGSRSKKAAQKVLDMGFEKVYDLKGGYMHWD
jgi:rhodanese-related sulfurtransferase